MIFPRLNLVVMVLAVLMRNSTIWDSRANYFMGSSLLLVWAILASAFWFVPTNDDSSLVSSSSSATGASFMGKMLYGQ